MKINVLNTLQGYLLKNACDFHSPDLFTRLSYKRSCMSYNSNHVAKIMKKFRYYGFLSRKFGFPTSFFLFIYCIGSISKRVRTLFSIKKLSHGKPYTVSYPIYSTLTEPIIARFPKDGIISITIQTPKI